jgi:chromosome segregation ATPase
MTFRTSEQKFTAFKNAAKLVNFIIENNLDDYEKLHVKVDETQDRLYDVRQALKTTEERLKGLNENVKQAVIFGQNKAVYSEYISLKPRKQPKLYAQHSTEIILFRNAERHLKNHLKEGKLPVKKWREEIAELTAEKDRLYGEYYKLKADITEIGKVKREVDKFVRIDTLDRAGMYEQRRNHDRGYER